MDITYDLRYHLWYPTLRTIVIIDHDRNGYEQREFYVRGRSSKAKFQNIYELPYALRNSADRGDICWQALKKVDPTYDSKSARYGCWFFYNEKYDIHCLLISSHPDIVKDAQVIEVDRDYFLKLWNE